MRVQSLQLFTRQHLLSSLTYDWIKLFIVIFALSVRRNPLAEIFWSHHCGESEKLSRYEVTTMLVFLWYFPETPLSWEVDALYWSELTATELSFCALPCFSSLSFHHLYGYAASDRGCKWWRTGAGILPACPWCYGPSASAWKLIYWLIPSWGNSRRNELQMPLEDLFHCWPVCFEQWVPFSSVSPHISFIHCLDFLLSFNFSFIFLPYEASKEIITSSMPARRQGWVH